MNSLPLDRLLAPLEAASDALVRLDERLRSSPVAEAFVVRAHFYDACAALWRGGEFVQVEDLVLHDANMNARAPTHGLVRAHTILFARRQIVSREPGWAMTTSGLDALRGGPTSNDSFSPRARPIRSIDDDDVEGPNVDRGDDEAMQTGEFDEIDALLARTSEVAKQIELVSVKRDDSGLVYDEDWHEDSRLAEWRECVAEKQTLPPLLAAGLALDAWEAIEPLQHRAWLGPLLTAELLRARGKTQRHLATLHAGLRLAKYRRIRQRDLATRLIVFAQAMEMMANTDSKELDRLTLARELLLT